MSDYDRYLEPPSTRSTERERTERFEKGSHSPDRVSEPGSYRTCPFEGEVEGTLYAEDMHGWWSGACPECGTELEREIDLYAEAEDARQAAQDEAMQERYP